MTDRFRVLVLDLDGTTLTADHRITERDLRAARALTERGVHVTIATGRLFTGTNRAANDLGVTGSVAVMNGSELIDAGTGLATHARYVERAHRRHIREVLSARGLSTFLFGSRTIHYNHTDHRHKPYLSIWTDQLTSHPDVFAAPAWDDDDVVAVSAIGRRVDLEHARDLLAAELPGLIGAEIFQTWEGDGFLNLRCPSEDKGTAFARLAAERGCTAEECVAVGDWLNDLPMLRVAGRSFAMGGSCDEVTSAASDVLSCKRYGGGAIAEVAQRVWGVEV